MLSQNPNAISILEKNPENIDWDMLSRNPNAIHILEKNPDKINWYWLCENPNAIHLLFTWDFNAMREKNMLFAEELAAYVFHPIRMGRICEAYSLDLEELNDIM
jgi:hypothetical protein